VTNKKKTKESAKRRKRRLKSVVFTRDLRTVLRVLLVLSPLLLTALLCAMLRTSMHIKDLEMNDLASQRRDLIKQNDTLRLQIETLQASKRIESIACKKLGMVSPQTWRVVLINEPMEPPATSVESDRTVQERSSFSQRPAGLFGFLKKRAKPGSIPDEDASSGDTRQSG
jgi:cell division protein FtsL